MQLPSNKRKQFDKKQDAPRQVRPPRGPEPFLFLVEVSPDFCFCPIDHTQLKNLSAYGNGILTIKQLGQVLYKQEVKGVTSVIASQLEADTEAPLVFSFEGVGSCQLSGKARFWQEKNNA